MGSRAGVAALVAASIFGFATASASACEDPAPQSATAAAGDSVAFELPGTSEGARYTLTIDGGQVHSGEDRDSQPGVSDAFTMPDLGSHAREVTVAIEVEEEHGRDCSGTLTVDYRGRPADPKPAPAPPPGGPAPRSTPGPAAPSSAPGPAAAAPAPVVAPAAPAAPKRARDRKGRSEVKGVRRVGGRRGSARRHAAGPRTRKVRRAKSRKRRKARRHRRHLVPLPADGPDAPRPTPPEVGGAKADLSGGEFPGLGYRVAWQLLLGAALAGLVLMALVALRTRRRRTATG